MEWYYWIIIYLLIIFIINMIFNYVAYRLGIYYEMQSMNNTEIKEISLVIMFFSVVILVLIGEILRLFKYDLFGIIFFGLLAILGGSLDKISRFIMALNNRDKNLPLEQSINKERRDRKEGSNKGLFIGAILIGLLSGSKNNKRKR